MASLVECVRLSDMAKLAKTFRTHYKINDLNLNF